MSYMRISLIAFFTGKSLEIRKNYLIQACQLPHLKHLARDYYKLYV